MGGPDNKPADRLAEEGLPEVEAWLRGLSGHPAPSGLSTRLPYSYSVRDTPPNYAGALPTLYLDATIQVTREWREQHRQRYSIYISDLVLDEAAVFHAGDTEAVRQGILVLQSFPRLVEPENTAALAERILTQCPLLPNAAMTARHIAIAALHRMQFFLTQHWVRPADDAAVAKACLEASVPCPRIRTPLDLDGRA